MSHSSIESPKHGHDHQPELSRALGPGMAMAIVIGNVIGAGIFLKPGEAALQAGSVTLSLLAWLAGGLLSLLGALTIAELALRMPQAGGLYVYIREAFGRPLAFLFGWSEFIIGIPASIGALADGSVSMIAELMGMQFEIWAKAACAILLIIGLAAINTLGVIWGGRAQISTTLVKCGFLIALAALPLVMGMLGFPGIDFANYAETTAVESGARESLPIRFAGALLAVLWAYSGWHAVAPVAEEVSRPRRNIPLALIGGGLILTGIYLAVVLAYHGVMSIEEIRAAGIKLPQAMTDILLTPWNRDAAALAVDLITIAAFISIAGSLNACLIAGPRVGFAMARDGVFPRSIARVHRRFRTPAVAILLQSGLSIVLVILSAALVASIEEFSGRSVFAILSNYVTFIASVFLTLAVAAIFPIRRKLGAPEGYHTPAYPWIPLAYIIASLLFIGSLLYAQPRDALVGMGLALIGLPAYWWFSRGGAKEEGSQYADKINHE